MKRKKLKRSEEGFSLVTVLGIGIVSTLWLSAMFSAVLPSYQKVSRVRTQNILRSCSEAAVDWAVQQLQTTGASIDDGNVTDTEAVTSNVPSDTMYNMGIPCSATVSVWAPRYTVPNTNPQQFSGVPTTSYLYEPNMVVTGNADTGWRIVDVTTRVSGMSTAKAPFRRVRVILRPNMSTSPLFNEALFADGQVQLNGAPNWFTDSYNSTAGAYGGGNVSNTDGDIGSNGKNIVSGDAIDVANAQIGGDLVVLKQPGGSTTREDATGGNGLRVYGKVMVNGIANSVFDTRSGTPIAASNVMESLNQPEKALPSVPSPPATANSSYTTISNNTTLPAGDYVVNTISLSGNKTLTTNGTAANPVRIWVQGTNSSVSVSGNASINNTGTPPGLQIFYAGTSDVSVSGNGTFKGVVYAPNAPMRLNGNAEMFGAAIAKTITMNGGGNGGRFHYDRALANMNILNSVVLAQRQTVSWQEI